MIVDTPFGARHGDALFAQENDEGVVRQAEFVQQGKRGFDLAIQLFDFSGVAGKGFPGSRRVDPVIGQGKARLVEVPGLAQVPGVMGVDGTDHRAERTIGPSSFLDELAETIRGELGDGGVGSGRESLDGRELAALVEMAFSREANVVAEGSQVIDDTLDAGALDLFRVGQGAIVDGQKAGVELGADRGALGDGAVETIEDEGLCRQLVDRRGAGEAGSRAAEGIVADIVGDDDENIGFFCCCGVFQGKNSAWNREAECEKVCRAHQGQSCESPGGWGTNNRKAAKMNQQGTFGEATPFGRGARRSALSSPRGDTERHRK